MSKIILRYKPPLALYNNQRESWQNLARHAIVSPVYVEERTRPCVRCETLTLLKIIKGAESTPVRGITSVIVVIVLLYTTEVRIFKMASPLPMCRNENV